ncbi:unnamed protein product [Polarella glacialis]|nr:unnamed protein product [Polarella glacialis]
MSLDRPTRLARQERLREEADALRERVRAAQGICLQEAEASCRKICQAATRAQQGLAEQGNDGQKVARLANRVRLVCDEGSMVTKLVDAAKHELQFSMEWSCAKPNTKGAEWLHGWAGFLEQLAQALGRVRLPAELPAPARIPLAAEEKTTPPVAVQPVLKDLTNAPPVVPLGAKKVDVMGSAALAAEIKEPVAHQAVPVRPERRKEAVRLDDDERAEDIFAKFAAMQRAGAQGIAPQATQLQNLPQAAEVKPRPRPELQTRVPFLEFDGKENVRY